MRSGSVSEALNRAGSGWEIVREMLMRPWSTGSDSLSRSRPASPVLVGDAIRNLRSSLDRVAYQPAVQHCGPLTEDAERMTGVTDPHFRRAVRRLGVLEEQTDEAALLGGLREAGFRTVRSGQPFAFAERLRRSADDRGRTPLVDRRRLRGDNDVGFVLNRLWNVYRH
jgi:hypothetical protein